MKLLGAALAVALMAMGIASSALADPSDYDLQAVEASTSTAQAGAHPDFTTAFSLKREANGELPSATKDTVIELPPGLLGNPTVVKECSVAQFASTDVETPGNTTGCPPSAQIGTVEVELFRQGSTVTLVEPLFNLQPRKGEPARFGFFGQSYPIMVGTRLRSDGDYGITATAEETSSLIPLLSAKVVIWAVPADKSHDTERITPYEAAHGGVPETPTGRRESSLALESFMVNPTRCGVPQGVNFAVTPYAPAGLRREAFAPLEENFGCDLLGFSPALSISPTTTQASSGAGLDVELEFPDAGLRDPGLKADATMKRAEVALPAGVTVNPSQAVGLSACSAADFAREAFDSLPGEGCPESSKVGSVVAKSPLLAESAEGSLFVAKPFENPFDTLIALYMVLKIPARGVIVKLPMKVEADPATGRLTSTVDDIPQLPVSSFKLHFRDGARAPLVTPTRCGGYESTATFTSWGGQVATKQLGFSIDSGPQGAPCLSGPLPFAPGFSAGTLSNSAGSYSPFDMRLTRRDGDRELTRFSATLPPGVTGKLAGIARCPDSAIESARMKSGLAERAVPSCPASSRVGHVLAGAGVGPVLTYAEGTLYLAGPYRGAPLSVAAIVPAVAGPFDIGTVVVRQGLRVNPRTGVVTADGEHADPLPRILAGIPLRARDVMVDVDREKFILNPTSCDPLQTSARLWGSGDAPGPLDDSPVSLSSRFQAANCSSLGFAPRLSLALRGGTTRGAHPALRGVYRPRRGDANLAGMVVRLPHSEFIDQAHFKTICTRVQFAAEACPAGAIYGRATAITPLLDEPLRGPIYLRSSNHKLPDLVADLHGVVDVEAVAHIDSVNGGLRATFTDVPDAPLTKVIVSMQGGKKGLIVNSTNLCRGRYRATARLSAQNAMRKTLNPALQVKCGAKHRRVRGRQ
jgi:hypothetical protein